MSVLYTHIRSQSLLALSYIFCLAKTVFCDFKYGFCSAQISITLRIPDNRICYGTKRLLGFLTRTATAHKYHSKHLFVCMENAEQYRVNHVFSSVPITLS